ncbi:glycosyltransferase family 8 protein, partial [Aureobasidium melanogenum]
MGKLLMTSGQVQVLLSSTFGNALSITLTFQPLTSFTVAAITFFLFLAGYTVQQRSIANLQSQLKPRIPIAPLSDSAQQPLSGPQHPSRLFNPDQNALISKHIASQEPQQVNWQKLAHVQVVTKHHDVCSTIMFFGDLARLKSPARRILLFPQAWAMEKQAAKHDLIDPYMDITRRLLRRAARRYNVELRPIPSSAGQEDNPLASLWALTDLQRVMLLQTPGLVQDAEALDAVLAYTNPAPMTLLQQDSDSSLTSEDLILATPAKETHRVLTMGGLQNITSLVTALHPAYLSSPYTIASIGILHAAVHPNKTAFMETPYIRFNDPQLPGPEWEVDYARIVEARPKDKDADWLWTKMYGEFAGRRYDICGLGLEVWRDE